MCVSLPYFPMYPSDFEAKTSHLTLAEDGAYNRLLRLMWMTPGCSIPDDNTWIKRRMRCSDADFADVVLGVIDEFLIREKGRVSSAKLTREFDKSHTAHKKRVDAGSRGGKAKSLKANKETPSNATAKPKQPEPEPEPYKKESTNVLLVQSDWKKHFQDFWDAYPHRGGKKNRGGAEKVFVKALKAGTTVQQIANGVQNMGNDPDVQRGFARDPTSWLNQEGWTDEFSNTPNFKAINGGRHEPNNQNSNAPQQSSGRSRSEQRDQTLADEILAAARAR